MKQGMKAVLEEIVLDRHNEIFEMEQTLLEEVSSKMDSFGYQEDEYEEASYARERLLDEVEGLIEEERFNFWR
jgi:hypothetical protein